MDKKKIKRIIAREALTIIQIIAISALLFYSSDIYIFVAKYIFHKTSIGPFAFDILVVLRVLSKRVLILTYPIYLLIRFIVLVVRKLKEKQI